MMVLTKYSRGWAEYREREMAATEPRDGLDVIRSSVTAHSMVRRVRPSNSGMTLPGHGTGGTLSKLLYWAGSYQTLAAHSGHGPMLPYWRLMWRTSSGSRSVKLEICFLTCIHDVSECYLERWVDYE